MHLESGKKYRAKIRLSWWQGSASNDQVRAKLEDAGFYGVTVTGSGRSRMAEGTWGGSSQDAELPEQVADVECV